MWVMTTTEVRDPFGLGNVERVSGLASRAAEKKERSWNAFRTINRSSLRDLRTATVHRLVKYPSLGISSAEESSYAMWVMTRTEVRSVQTGERGASFRVGLPR